MSTRRKSKSSSMLIQTFTEAKHHLELMNDKQKLTNFRQVIKKRRLAVKGQKKQEQTFNQSIQLAEKFKSMEDHKISIKEFSQKYSTNIEKGLTDEEAQKRLTNEGPNKLTEKSTVHWSLKLLHQLTNPFAILLWAGGILCFVAYLISPDDPSNLYLGIVIFVINLMSGLMSFYQNNQSQAIMDSFKDFIPPETIVLRNGVESKLDATKLVVGDVVIIELGKKIPADLRIIDSQGMKVDNSSLTGETELLPRSSECTNDNPLETKNVAFFSTLNKQGTGKGIVFATGDRTFIGQIANLAANANGVIVCQMVNIFACKTRKLSLLSQGLANTFMLFSLTTQVMLILIAAYFQPFNTAFGTRDNIFMHFGTPAIPFAIIQLVIDEIRKFLLRNLKPDKFGKPHWFTRAALW